jgi:hypothetical protein
MGCGSGPDPSQGSAALGVQVSTNNNGGYTQGIALGSNALYAAYSGSLTLIRFDGSGSKIGQFNEGGGSVLEVAVAADGSVWWMGGGMGPGPGCTMGGQSMELWTSTDSAFLTTNAGAPPAGVVCSTANVGNTPTGSPTAYGLVADDRWVIVAIASTSMLMSGPSSVPDAQNWPGQQAMLAPSLGASLQRFDRQSASPSLQPLAGVSSLATALTSHVLAQSTDEVYWLDASNGSSDSVMRASKSQWSSGQLVAIAASNSLTGIAANDQYVAWASSVSPSPGATGCAVFASHADGPPEKIYDGAHAPFLCWGMALDDAYAYFTTTQVVMQFPNDQGGPTYMMGTGLGRVPLAGGPLETVPLASSRWYGARRVLVDAQYVYAVDPSFVVRVDKSAFGG